jgi:hypothetical protein
MKKIFLSGFLGAVCFFGEAKGDRIDEALLNMFGFLHYQRMNLNDQYYECKSEAKKALRNDYWLMKKQQKEIVLLVIESDEFNNCIVLLIDKAIDNIAQGMEYREAFDEAFNALEDLLNPLVEESYQKSLSLELQYDEFFDCMMVRELSVALLDRLQLKLRMLGVIGCSVALDSF